MLYLESFSLEIIRIDLKEIIKNIRLTAKNNIEHFTNIHFLIFLKFFFFMGALWIIIIKINISIYAHKV